MKNIILLVALISSGIANAQIVNIPDAQFKAALLRASPENSDYYHIAKDIDGNWVTIDVNNDNEIQVSEAETIFYLNINYETIYELTGVEDFINLEFLYCYGNNLTNLDLSNNMNLKKIGCGSNQLTNLDLSNHTNLEDLNCDENPLTSLDLSNNTNLKKIECSHNQLTNLNVSNNISLDYLYSINLTAIDYDNIQLFSTLRSWKKRISGS